MYNEKKQYSNPYLEEVVFDLQDPILVSGVVERSEGTHSFGPSADLSI